MSSGSKLDDCEGSGDDDFDRNIAYGLAEGTGAEC